MILIIINHYPSLVCSSGNVSLLFTYDHGKKARDETPYPLKFFIFLNYTLKKSFSMDGEGYWSIWESLPKVISISLGSIIL